MPHPGEPTQRSGSTSSTGSTDGTDPVDETVMELLADHVPLTLLVDLVDAPPSEQVLAEEGLPEQRWWEHDRDEEPGTAPDRG